MNGRSEGNRAARPKSVRTGRVQRTKTYEAPHDPSTSWPGLNVIPAFLKVSHFCDIVYQDAAGRSNPQCAGAAEIRALPADMRARLAAATSTSSNRRYCGAAARRVKHLDGKLWELRITGRDGISRAIYVTAGGRRVVMVRVIRQEDAEDAAARA